MMSSLHLRHAAMATLAVLAATAALGAGSGTAYAGVSGTAIVVMLAPLRRDPAGAAAVPTEPWPGAAGVPGGLVPLMPGVGIRLPTARPIRPRRGPARPRLPRGTTRAIAFVLVAVAVTVAVFRSQVQLDCANFLSLLYPEECSWHTEITREGVAAVSALLLSIAYAANTLLRRS